jgi:ribA/ribD-fused uncharacterized protein
MLMTAEQRTQKIEEIHMVSPNAVYGFFKDHRYLSNFHECKITFEGIIYDSTEAAYQASKSLDPQIRLLFANMNANYAKNKGQKIEMRPDWAQVKDKIMGRLLFIKFLSNHELAQKIVSTGSKYLEETNYWGDRYWGADEKHVGENRLGKMLMYVRDFLKHHS